MVLKFPGVKANNVRNLHWVEPEFRNFVSENPLGYLSKTGKQCQRRLFSTGLNGTVLEWNFSSLTYETKVEIGSPIWDSCLYEDSLFLACQDGSIREYSIEETKEVLKIVPHESHKATAIAASHVEKFTFFVGYDDGTI
jgi:WD40 repeat protein